MARRSTQSIDTKTPPEVGILLQQIRDATSYSRCIQGLLQEQLNRIHRLASADIMQSTTAASLWAATLGTLLNADAEFVVHGEYLSLFRNSSAFLVPAALLPGLAACYGHFAMTVKHAHANPTWSQFAWNTQADAAVDREEIALRLLSIFCADLCRIGTPVMTARFVAVTITAVRDADDLRASWAKRAAASASAPRRDVDADDYEVSMAALKPHLARPVPPAVRTFVMRMGLAFLAAPSPTIAMKQLPGATANDVMACRLPAHMWKERLRYLTAPAEVAEQLSAEALCRARLSTLRSSDSVDAVAKRVWRSALLTCDPTLAPSADRQMCVLELGGRRRTYPAAWGLTFDTTKRPEMEVTRASSAAWRDVRRPLVSALRTGIRARDAATSRFNLRCLTACHVAPTLLRTASMAMAPLLTPVPTPLFPFLRVRQLVGGPSAGTGAAPTPPPVHTRALPSDELRGTRFLFLLLRSIHTTRCARTSWLTTDCRAWLEAAVDWLVTGLGRTPWTTVCPATAPLLKASPDTAALLFHAVRGAVVAHHSPADPDATTVDQAAAWTVASVHARQWWSIATPSAPVPHARAMSFVHAGTPVATAGPMVALAVPPTSGGEEAVAVALGETVAAIRQWVPSVCATRWMTVGSAATPGTLRLHAPAADLRAYRAATSAITAIAPRDVDMEGGRLACHLLHLLATPAAGCQWFGLSLLHAAFLGPSTAASLPWLPTAAGRGLCGGTRCSPYAVAGNGWDVASGTRARAPATLLAALADPKQPHLLRTIDALARIRVAHTVPTAAWDAVHPFLVIAGREHVHARVDGPVVHIPGGDAVLQTVDNVAAAWRFRSTNETVRAQLRAFLAAFACVDWQTTYAGCEVRSPAVPRRTCTHVVCEAVATAVRPGGEAAQAARDAAGVADKIAATVCRVEALCTAEKRVCTLPTCRVRAAVCGGRWRARWAAAQESHVFVRGTTAVQGIPSPHTGFMCPVAAVGWAAEVAAAYHHVAHLAIPTIPAIPATH